MKVLYTPRALTDLEAIADFVAENDTNAADRLIARIEEHVARLSQHPYLGRAGRVDGTRELVVYRTRYVVAYRVHTNSVEILAVVHDARRWPQRF